MRLTRNTTADGRCKYALVRMDKIRLNETGEEFSTEAEPEEIQKALDLLHREGLLEYGEKGSVEEFFAIKLKDKFAPEALQAYAEAVEWSCEIGDEDDPSGMRDYAEEIRELVTRAGNRTDATTPD